MAEASGTLVTVRLFAGARAAAGTSDAQVEAPAGSAVRAVLDRLVVDHPGVARVLPACSFLLDGVAARPESLLGTARTLDVLPPFSGG